MQNPNAWKERHDRLLSELKKIYVALKAESGEVFLSRPEIVKRKRDLIDWVERELLTGGSDDHRGRDR